MLFYYHNFFCYPYKSYNHIRTNIPLLPTQKERAPPLANHPPAVRNSGFAHALYPPSYDKARHPSLHRYDFLHNNDVRVKINSVTYIKINTQVTSISSREHVTFVATPKSSNSIVHSSCSGSVASSFPVIPAKAPSSTLT